MRFRPHFGVDVPTGGPFLFEIPGTALRLNQATQDSLIH